MAHNLGLVIAKAVQGQLAAGVPARDIVRQAALFGARNLEGWSTGMTIMTALGNLMAILRGEDDLPRAASWGAQGRGRL